MSGGDPWFGYGLESHSASEAHISRDPKYQQKRVGYLAAVQSFRPDTEVLMLATNLLKKVWRSQHDV